MRHLESARGASYSVRPSSLVPWGYPSTPRSYCIDPASSQGVLYRPGTLPQRYCPEVPRPDARAAPPADWTGVPLVPARTAGWWRCAPASPRVEDACITPVSLRHPAPECLSQRGGPAIPNRTSPSPTFGGDEPDLRARDPPCRAPSWPGVCSGVASWAALRSVGRSGNRAGGRTGDMAAAGSPEPAAAPLDRSWRDLSPLPSCTAGAPLPSARPPNATRCRRRLHARRRRGQLPRPPGAATPHWSGGRRRGRRRRPRED